MPDILITAAHKAYTEESLEQLGTESENGREYDMAMRAKIWLLNDISDAKDGETIEGVTEKAHDAMSTMLWEELTELRDELRGWKE